MNHTITLTDERDGRTTTIYVTSDEHTNADDILFDAFTNGAWEDENGQQPANLHDMWNNQWATAQLITTTAA